MTFLHWISNQILKLATFLQGDLEDYWRGTTGGGSPVVFSNCCQWGAMGEGRARRQRHLVLKPDSIIYCCAKISFISLIFRMGNICTAQTFVSRFNKMMFMKHLVNSKWMEATAKCHCFSVALLKFLLPHLLLPCWFTLSGKGKFCLYF